MIYTVTFNPAIDYVVELVSFNIGEINRTTREYMNLGGKGVNVSRVLTNLEVPNVALGFVAGFTGVPTQCDHSILQRAGGPRCIRQAGARESVGEQHQYG